MITPLGPMVIITVGTGEVGEMAARSLIVLAREPLGARAGGVFCKSCAKFNVGLVDITLRITPFACSYFLSFA